MKVVFLHHVVVDVGLVFILLPHGRQDLLVNWRVPKVCIQSVGQFNFLAPLCYLLYQLFIRWDHA